MIKRDLTDSIKELTKYYPVVSVTGPRQSGKSTLIKSVFPDYNYIDLENPSVLAFAIEDPEGFINDCKNNTIIDEAQFAPELFSAIKVFVDEDKTNKKFILSGSQNFLLSKNIKQSLAGRVGITELLPLSYSELTNSVHKINIDNIIMSGGYPGLYSNNIPSPIFYKNYIETYIQRDASSYLAVRNILDFGKFIQLLATNVGQILNYSRLARDLGVELKTVKFWLSSLVSSYIINIVPAYSYNMRKRIIKSPKIYFVDTGLLCYLLDIYNVDMLKQSSMYGLIFENFVMSETYKKYTNKNVNDNLFFYRDSNKKEIDLIDYSNIRSAAAIEIKSSSTFNTKYNYVLKNAKNILNISNLTKKIVYRGDRKFNFKGTDVIPVEDYLIDVTT